MAGSIGYPFPAYKTMICEVRRDGFVSDNWTKRRRHDGWAGRITGSGEGGFVFDCMYCLATGLFLEALRRSGGVDFRQLCSWPWRLLVVE